MTGGRVVVLGPTGRNFAAGMSGGVAYVLDVDGKFSSRCNKDMVELEALTDNDEIEEVRNMIEKHLDYTGSNSAAKALKDWDATVSKFVKVMPRDYKRMLQAIKHVHDEGLTGDDALMAAFQINSRDLARVGGN
jgi:glutamate synthase (ferredoxin)